MFVINFLKLIRIQNLFIIAFTQYAMRWAVVAPILRVNNFEFQFSEFHFFLLVKATVFLAAAGYVINDYFDTKTDLLNRPKNVIVGRSISRRAAMISHSVFNILAILIGFYIAYSIHLIELGFVFILVAGILWYYSTSYKRQFLIGNLIVALLTGMVPFMVALFEIPPLNVAYRDILLQSHSNFNVIFLWVAAFAYFAFITTLIREIIKDIEDLEGDNAYGRNTLPIAWGIKNTKIVLVILILFTAISLYYIYFTRLHDALSFWYLTVALIMPFLFLIYRIVIAEKTADYHFASKLTKFIMLFGILYLLVANYQWYQLAQ